MEERQQIFWSIIEKAAADSEFHDALVADARSAIGKEFDIQVPDSIDIVVHENDPGTVHLPLPAKPEVLSEGDLKEVSGGTACMFIACAKCL